MKISEITEAQLLALPAEVKWNFLFGGICDDMENSDCALLLGTEPGKAKSRAEAAAKLYLDGRVRYIVPSGGVEWDVGGGEKLSEANYMRNILLSNGVPSDAIIMENEARTTKENMIYGTLRLNRTTKFYDEKRVTIVTSQNHMKRSLALAKTFLPRMVRIFCYPSSAEFTYEQFLDDPEFVDRELHLIHGLVHKGIVEDMEI